MNNQFFHRGAIHDPAYFFDRASEIERASMLLARGQSVALVGPRRIGKTSLLLRLMQALVGVGERVGYLDCQTWVQLSPGAVFARVAQAFSRPGDAAIAPALAAELPIHEVQRQADVVRRDGRPAVILLDELDALCARFDDCAELQAGLRALAMSGGVCFVTASVRPVQDWVSGAATSSGAPSLNFLVQMRLGLFSRAEAADLLLGLSARGGLAFDAGLTEWLIDLAGVHPLYLQVAGYCAFDYLTAQGEGDSPHARECIRQSFLDEVAPHWRYAWNTLSDEDRHLLATLPLGWQLAPNAVQRLTNAGLVVRGPGSQAAWLSAELQAFIARQPITGLVQLPPVTLDAERRAVLVRGAPAEVPPSEFDLLACLMEARGKIVRHEELEQHIWSQRDVDGGERLKSTVKNLRRCLGDAAACIENVRGVGYRFNRLCD